MINLLIISYKGNTFITILEAVYIGCEWPLYCVFQKQTKLSNPDDVIKWTTLSALLAICAGNSPATGEIPAQKPVTRSFDVFFDLRLNKRLSKQSWCWWFETPSHPLWRHCNVYFRLGQYQWAETQVWLLRYMYVYVLLGEGGVPWYHGSKKGENKIDISLIVSDSFPVW